jgi:hypothetical protein
MSRPDIGARLLLHAYRHGQRVLSRARQPRFVPGVDPVKFPRLSHTFGPLHPDWKTLSGDVWDKPDWSKYKEPGEPTNPNAWGGHSDALDWDRHAGHVSIIYDLLLPYLLSSGKINDDNLDIAESGNGIPTSLTKLAMKSTSGSACATVRAGLAGA